MIAPMLFLPFVENAFKHGVSNITEGYILIIIIQKHDHIELSVTNTVYESRRASEDQSNGIGLLNTTRRLELLYPGKYKLSTGMISEIEYQAKLTLFI
jgi:sensor histidine kinase YesM